MHLATQRAEGVVSPDMGRARLLDCKSELKTMTGSGNWGLIVSGSEGRFLVRTRAIYADSEQTH